MNFKPAAILFLLLCSTGIAQEFGKPATEADQRLVQETSDGPPKELTADQLRGSITDERSWWDVQHYHLSVLVYPDEKRIAGSNVITFKTLKSGDRMQIDLQKPLEITGARLAGADVELEREGNVYWLSFSKPLAVGEIHKVTVYYEGKPKVSKRPPWQGGLTWAKDSNGKHNVVTTCQGIGASIWWPNKDHGYDEPDLGMKISVTVPEDLVAVSNGRLTSTTHDPPLETKTYHWSVTHPINNYCVNLNIGDYVNFADKFDGEAGELDMDYWVLASDRKRAEKQFKEAPRTIKAFEHWFGKYPFYEDSYKLVQVPYPGMEHQSSVTYGNGFKNGYGGRDLSNTGVGMKFDFIIVHETGHEWFGNNVSMRDAADMWIHEGFTNYSENLFVEYHFTEKEAQDYVIGCRRLVSNDKPIIGEYGLNKRGSGDMYYKGGNMLHTMRHILDDTDKWRSILRGLNRDFWHQTVTTQQIESYLNEKSGIDFSKFFDQYLRTVKIPKLVYKTIGKELRYKFENVVDGFSFRTKVKINDTEKWITPTQTEQTLTFDSEIETFELDRNFYYKTTEPK